MESTEKDYSTLGSVAALIEQTLRHYQCEPAALFLKAGIDIEHINDPAVRFPLTRMQKLWRYAVDETGDPCFGLKGAEYPRPAHLGALGFAWLASSSLRTAFQRLSRYARVINEQLTVEDRKSVV